MFTKRFRIILNTFCDTQNCIVHFVEVHESEINKVVLTNFTLG